MRIRIFIFLVVLFAGVNHIKSQKKNTDSLSRPLITYGKKGFEFRSIDSNYLMQLEWRGQFRFAYPTDNDPVSLNDFDDNKLHLYINRARMKVGGHSFKPYFKYYLEYELASSNLLDFRLMIEKYSFLKLKVGQWKIQYNRERIISSGKQQTMERSILTRPFTLDRQQGFSVFGHLKGSGLADFNYWLSVLMGTGRGNETNDDHHLMYMTRWQWNFMGRKLAFSGSDLDYHENLAGIAAIAFVTNQSPYTRFSQSGGGQLEGFADGLPGQYRINQSVFETAGMYRGFSWQQELHWKQIDDNVNNEITMLVGNLIQFGYFPNALWEKFPEYVEIYARQAFYIPNIDRNQNQQEYTLGLNWFLNGHRNKLTLESSYLEHSLETENLKSGFRFRLQWDVSF
jgi:phosphate-selective porin